MLYLLDADTLITSNRVYYQMKRWQPFWSWLFHKGGEGVIKIPIEQYEEITVGTKKDDLVAWLCDEDVRSALVLDENADPAIVTEVVQKGYAPNLTEVEIGKVGRDPFLISYAYTAPHDRCIVSFENSSPGKSRGNRKVPDVCNSLGVKCMKLFGVIDELDFTTDWNSGH